LSRKVFLKAKPKAALNAAHQKGATLSTSSSTFPYNMNSTRPSQFKLNSDGATNTATQ